MAILTIAIALTVTLVAPSSHAANTATSSDAITEEQRAAAMLASAEQQGIAKEQQRIQDYMAKGMTKAEAEEKLLAEDEVAGDHLLRQWAELSSQGKSSAEIAEITGMIPVGGADNNTVNDAEEEGIGTRVSYNLCLPKTQLYYYPDNNHWLAEQAWEHCPDLLEGRDSVGVRFNRRVISVSEGMIWAPTTPIRTRAMIPGTRTKMGITGFTRYKFTNRGVRAALGNSLTGR